MTKEEATQAAAEKLHELLWRAQQQKQPTLLLVSGGSALAMLDLVETSVFGEYLTTGVLDERYSEDPNVNNFVQFMKSQLFVESLAVGAHYIDTRLHANESIEQLASRFETELKNWRAQNPNGTIIITQGMGPDGHTSGIMPYPEDPKLFSELFEQPEKWVIGYNAGIKNQYPLRVSTTITFLKEVDQTILFVCGEDKQIALSKLNNENVTLAEIPAAVVKQMKKVWFFTDLTSSFKTA